MLLIAVQSLFSTRYLPPLTLFPCLFFPISVTKVIFWLSFLLWLVSEQSLHNNIELYIQCSLLYPVLNILEVRHLHVHMITEKRFGKSSCFWLPIFANFVSTCKKPAILWFIGWCIAFPEAGANVLTCRMMLYMGPVYIFPLHLIVPMVALAFLYFTYLFIIGSLVLEQAE